VKEVVTSLTINPNTVLHAYGQLDLEGLVEGRRGVGTFVSADPVPPPPDELKSLRSSLERWTTRARAAGLDDESMAALLCRRGPADDDFESRMSESIAVRNTAAARSRSSARATASTSAPARSTGTAPPRTAS
jgi:DNA-binding GntR family transcriptional regulator